MTPSIPARARAAAASPDDAAAPVRAGRIARAGAATVGGQFAGTLVSLGAMVVLARLLEPRDFGLVAMVYALAAFIASFRDLGLPMAALQSQSLDHQQASALFWIHLPIALAIAAFMAAMGPALAWLFAEPRLVLLTAVMSTGVLAATVVSQHEAQLMRRIEFAVIVKVDLLFAVLAAAVAIAMAAAGAGFWALATQFIVAQVGRAAAVWILSGWTPAGVRASRGAWGRVRPLLSFGAYLTGYRVLAHLCRDLDRVLVGFAAGAHALGLYDAALRWARLPIQQVFTPLLGPAVAGLSRASDDAAFRARARGILLPVLAVTMPALVFAAVAAESVIAVLLGPSWGEAAPLLRILCIGTVALAALKTTKWIYVSRGETRRQFRWGLVSSPVFAMALIAGMPWGALGVATGYAAGQWALLIPGLAYCLRRAPISMPQYLGIVARPLLAASVAAGAALGVAQVLSAPHAAVELAVKGATFAAVYAAAWLALPGGRGAAAEGIRLLRSIRGIDPADRGSAHGVPAAAKGA